MQRIQLGGMGTLFLALFALTIVVYVVFFRLLYLPLPLGPIEALLR